MHKCHGICNFQCCQYCGHICAYALFSIFIARFSREKSFFFSILFLKKIYDNRIIKCQEEVIMCVFNYYFSFFWPSDFFAHIEIYVFFLDWVYVGNRCSSPTAGVSSSMPMLVEVPQHGSCFLLPCGYVRCIPAVCKMLSEHLSCFYIDTADQIIFLLLLWVLYLLFSYILRKCYWRIFIL